MTSDVLIAALETVSAVLLLAGFAAMLVYWKGCRVLRHIARGSTRDDTPLLLKSPRVPAVSALAVARDASEKSRYLVRRLLDMHFGHHELVLVLESVSEEDIAIWQREFHLVPSHRSTGGELTTARVLRVWESTDPLSMLVLEKEPAGEADAWNAAVNAATSPVIALIGADNEFIPEVLLRLIRPMLDDPDLVFAVCGTAPPPAASGLAGAFADLEATRQWLGRCAAFSAFKNMLAPVPGAAVLVRRDAIVAGSGFCAGPLELMLHLQGRARQSAKPYRVAFVPEPVSYFPAPRGMKALREWLLRDQNEVRRALRHSASITGGRFSLGWGLAWIRGFGFWLPLLETAAYLATAAGLLLRAIPLDLALLVLLASAGTGILVSMSAVILRELADYRGSDPARLARLFWAAIPENLGYRQIRNLWLIGRAGFSRREA